MDYNIKPLDMLYLFTKEELQGFCEQYQIKSRGNIRLNIIENYRDIKNLYLENYDLIARRDLNGLAERGISIKEAEIGVKFEELTKEIWQKLGFNVDEKLRKKLNSKRGLMDILLNIGDNEVIIVECKTQKDKDFNKYTSVTRQLQSYEKLCTENSLKVNQVILVAPEFSEEFINECEYEPELSFSLITSAGLYSILEAYKTSKRQDFPTKLLYKGGMLDSSRIASVIAK